MKSGVERVCRNFSVSLSLRLATFMDRLVAEIGNELPQSQRYKLWYCQTNPVKVKPLVTTRKNTESIDSYKIRHFFQLLNHDNVIVFGIEILVYLQIHPDHVDEYIFVSKCDTIGIVKSQFKIGKVISKILTYLIKYDVNQYKIKKSREVKGGSLGINHQTGYLIDSLVTKLQNKENVEYKKATKEPVYIELPGQVNVKLTLFTRSSDQYLYPHSSKNPHKHLIDGGQLLKWWLKVIDETLDNWRKTLLIPGGDTTHYLLPGWEEGHIFHQYPDNPAVYSIPLLPDDPKGRFLEHLIVENRYNKVNIDQFYYELGYRQEFRLGDIVGLIGCEGNYSPQTTELPPVISIKNYKQLINEIKSTSCNNLADLQNLVVNKFVDINNKFGSSVNQYDIIGKKTKSDPQNIQAPAKRVNNLTGLIKRKKVKP